MKVLILDQFSEMGGAQRCLTDLTPALLEAGWDVHAGLPGPGPLAQFFADAGVPVHFIRCGPYTQGRKTIVDVLRFAMDYRATSAVISRLIGGCNLIYVNGPRLLPAAVQACRGMRVLFHSHSRVSGRYAVSLAGRVLRQSNALVIASSRFVAEPWLRYADSMRVKVIYNGTPELAFRPRPAPHRRPWTIGVIGRMSPEKGQLEFVHAARILAARGRPVKFVIQGASLWSSPGYMESVRSASDGLEVAYYGWDEPVASTLHSIDMLVVPSPADESCTRVIPEAFSAGTPVVAFPSGGIPEIVRHGETGFLAPELTVQALADAIAGAIEHAGDLPRIVATARRKWETEFTVQRYCEEIKSAMLAQSI